MFKVAVPLFALVSSVSAFASLTVSRPVNGTTVTNPFRVVASDPEAVSFRVYVDGVSKYAAHGTSIDTTINANVGQRSVVVATWDRNGNVERYAVNVTARNRAFANTLSNLEEYLWSSCGTCGNHIGDIRHVLGGQAFGTATLLKGKSSKFAISGTNPYTNYYWYLKVGWNQKVNRIRQSFDLYVPSNADPQAIEFEGQYRWNGYIYNLSISLGYKSRRWKTFDFIDKVWKDTGLTFTPLKTNKWNRLEAEWEIDHVNHARKLVAITVNGDRVAPLNAGYLPAMVNNNGYNYMTVAAFQLDMNRSAQDYHVFVDNFTFQYE